MSIYESLVTVEYLDDVYPQRPLLSKDPVQKAFDKIIIEASGPVSRKFIYGSIQHHSTLKSRKKYQAHFMNIMSEELFYGWNILA